jgi:hypothetical protein
VQVKVTLEAGDLLAYMRKGAQSVRFAAANALNETVKRVQTLERAHVRHAFTLRPRGGEFVVRQAAVIKPFASAKRIDGLSTTVQVGQPPRLLLARFERGEPKTPQPGRRAIAVPVAARPSFTQNVPPAMFISGFRLHDVGRRIVGARRTFVKRGIGIFQQRSGEAPPVLLYKFRAQARLDRRLRFVAIGLGAVPYFYDAFQREVNKAIAFKFEHYGEKAFSA